MYAFLFVMTTSRLHMTLVCVKIYIHLCFTGLRRFHLTAKVSCFYPRWLESYIWGFFHTFLTMKNIRKGICGVVRNINLLSEDLIRESILLGIKI